MVHCNVLVGKIFLLKSCRRGGGGRVRIIPAPLLHSFCSAPPEIESQLRAWSLLFTHLNVVLGFVGVDSKIFCTTVGTL